MSRLPPGSDFQASETALRAIPVMVVRSLWRDENRAWLWQQVDAATEEVIGHAESEDEDDLDPDVAQQQFRQVVVAAFDRLWANPGPSVRWHYGTIADELVQEPVHRPVLRRAGVSRSALVEAVMRATIRAAVADPLLELAIRIFDEPIEAAIIEAVSWVEDAVSRAARDHDFPLEGIFDLIPQLCRRMRPEFDQAVDVAAGHRGRSASQLGAGCPAWRPVAGDLLLAIEGVQRDGVGRKTTRSPGMLGRPLRLRIKDARCDAWRRVRSATGEHPDDLREERRGRKVSAETWAACAADSVPDPVEAEDDLEFLLRKVQELSPEGRRAVALQIQEGKSYAETGRELGRSDKTVRSIVEAALRKLREDFGLEESEKNPD